MNNNDVLYLCDIFLRKMIKLVDLSLDLENNLITNDDLDGIIMWIDSLDNLTNLSLEI